VWLVVPNKQVLAFAALINLSVFSLPLLFIAVDFTALLSNPAIWIFYTLITLFCILESNASLLIGSGVAVKADKSFLPYSIGIIVLLLFWVSLYEFVSKPYVSWLHLNWLQWLSASCLMLAGIYLRVISIKTLNKYFLSHIGLASKHRLITTGIYARMRHPSEAGLLLICIAVPILLGSLNGLLLAMLLIVPLSLYRINREDKLMRGHFTHSFDDYRQTTPALIPKLNG